MIKKIMIGLLAFSPSVMFAAGQDVTGLVLKMISIANNLYILVFVLIILAFAWGVLKFVFKSGDDSAEGKSMMIWSMVALFVLVSVWGIIKILQTTLGIDDGATNAINAPSIPHVNPITVQRVQRVQ